MEAGRAPFRSIVVIETSECVHLHITHMQVDMPRGQGEFGITIRIHRKWIAAR